LRLPIIAGNWKMHKTIPETRKLVYGIVEKKAGLNNKCEVIIAPPFTALFTAGEAAKGSEVKIAAQNIHWEEKGAFTGEVSAGMLVDAGCTYVIIGHSERRLYFGETNETVNLKVKSALKSGLKLIICVGETLSQRERGITLSVIKGQVEGGLKYLSLEDMLKVVIAYEPVWAIGTGKTATKEQAQEVHAFIRESVRNLFNDDISESLRILYGGSVKPSNIKELMSMPDIDGALVGGASLDVESFIGIVNF